MVVRGSLAAVTSAVGLSSFSCSQLHRESIFYEPGISLLIGCLSSAWSSTALLLSISHCFLLVPVYSYLSRHTIYITTYSPLIKQLFGPLRITQQRNRPAAAGPSHTHQDFHPLLHNLRGLSIDSLVFGRWSSRSRHRRIVANRLSSKVVIHGTTAHSWIFWALFCLILSSLAWSLVSRLSVVGRLHLLHHRVSFTRLRPPTCKRDAVRNNT